MFSIAWILKRFALFLLDRVVCYCLHTTKLSKVAREGTYCRWAFQRCPISSACPPPPKSLCHGRKAAQGHLYSDVQLTLQRGANAVTCYALATRLEVRETRRAADSQRPIWSRFPRVCFRFDRFPSWPRVGVTSSHTFLCANFRPVLPSHCSPNAFQLQGGGEGPPGHEHVQLHPEGECANIHFCSWKPLKILPLLSSPLLPTTRNVYSVNKKVLPGATWAVVGWDFGANCTGSGILFFPSLCLSLPPPPPRCRELLP